MRRHRPTWKTLAVSVLVTGAMAPAPDSLQAQIVPVKTVPVAAGDQFLLFPSATRGMGGVGLALTDTLGDPFGNPANGSRVSESLFFLSPTYYGISDRNGSGRTLPMGLLFPGERWFGGVAASIQELTGADRNGAVWPAWDFDPFSSWAPPPVETLSEASSRNLYSYGYLGYRFPERGLSVALSGSYADLGAVDGVELLYAMAQEIRQSGHASTAPKEIAATLEIVVQASAACGYQERAARLHGAAAALRERIGAPIPPAERGSLHRAVSDIRAALGDETFASAEGAGRDLAPEQAVAEALILTKELA